jgi:hypothetical protein
MNSAALVARRQASVATRRIRSTRCFCSFLLADLERAHRARHRRPAEPARRLQPLPQLHRFRKRIDHVQLVALGLGDQHAAGIRAEIERGIEIGRIGTVDQRRPAVGRAAASWA